MKKSIKIISVVLVVLIALATIAWFSPFTSKFMKEKALSTYVNLKTKKTLTLGEKKYFIPFYKTTIGIKNTDVEKGNIVFKDFFVKSPEGFEKDIVAIKEFALNIDVNSIIEDEIVVNKLSIDGLNLNITDGVENSNLEVLASNVMKFLIENLPEIKNAIENENNLEKAEGILFGDSLVKFEKDSEDVALTFLGADKKFIEAAYKIYSEDTDIEKNKQVFFKELSLTNSAISYDDLILTIPNLEIVNYYSNPEKQQDFFEDNQLAFEKFNEEMMAQADNRNMLFEKFVKISDNLSKTLSEVIALYMELFNSMGNNVELN